MGFKGHESLEQGSPPWLWPSTRSPGPKSSPGELNVRPMWKTPIRSCRILYQAKELEVYAESNGESLRVSWKKGT